MSYRAFHRETERGLTLLELLVASAVLAIAAVGLAATMASAPSALQRSRESMIAESAMERALAAVSAESIHSVAATYSGRGFEVPGLQAQPDDEDGVPGEIRFEMGPGEFPNHYVVDIRIAWEGISGPREIVSRQYLANSRGEVGPIPPIPLTTVNREPLSFVLDATDAQIQ